MGSSSTLKHLDITTYEKVVSLLATSKSTRQFTNAGKDYATIVMKNIFKTSESSILLFAGGLKGDVSQGEYLAELENYLQKKSSYLTVLLEKAPPEDTDYQRNYRAISLIKKYRALNKNRFKIKVISQEKLDWLKNKYNGKVFHFTVGDYRMYRFETEMDNYEAIACFNDPKSSSILSERFATILEGSRDLE